MKEMMQWLIEVFMLLVHAPGIDRGPQGFRPGNGAAAEILFVVDAVAELAHTDTPAQQIGRGENQEKSISPCLVLLAGIPRSVEEHIANEIILGRVLSKAGERDGRPEAPQFFHGQSMGVERFFKRGGTRCLGECRRQLLPERPETFDRLA
jgi:hypothetical protein